jgi:hypothetical protein
MDLMKQLDLRKNIVLDLKKKKGIEGLKAQVVFSLDFSGSMNELYQSGMVQRLVERILPLGLAFDDNAEVDFYLFETGCTKMKENITLSNVAGYIDSKVLGKYNMGGTQYAPVINAIVKEFSNKKMFGGYGQLSLPVYVIMVTDGDNSDKSEAETAIKNAAKAGIFFQFIGIGRSTFPFLEKLDTMSDRVIDNANFFPIDNIESKTDDQLYELLLNEFPGFIPQAKAKGLLAS